MTKNETTPRIKSIVAGSRPSTGNVFLCTDDGQRIDFPPEQAAGIAVMLAEFGFDNDERVHVADEWCELDDEDIEHMRGSLQTSPDPSLPLGRFQAVDTALDSVTAIVVEVPPRW